MTGNLVYWAQALDNASPDHINLRGKELSPEDAIRRQEAVSLVSSVARLGSRIFSEGGVQLTQKGSRFVVEVHSEQLDQAGRIAPIICCGEYDARIDEAFGATVADCINDFAHSIGRTVRREHLDITRSAFLIVKKKFSTRRRVRILLIGTMVPAALLALIYMLAFRKS